MQDLNEKITEQFIMKILSGEWICDEWLPPERTLAEDFKVGRPTIHTVLIRLQEIGLIEIIPRHGVKVRNFLLNGKIGAVEIIIELFKNEIPDEMKESLYRFISDNLSTIVENCMKENHCAAPILHKMSPSDRINIVNNRDSFSCMVFEFYQNLAVGTGNMIYPLLVNSLKNGIQNAASYVKDRQGILEKLLILESSVLSGDCSNARLINSEILTCVYNDWK